MKHFVALAVFVLTASVTAQVEHAPTVAQCQADQRLWLAQVEDIDHRSDLPKFFEINDRMKEMGECEKVDPVNRRRYSDTQCELGAEQTLRLMKFIQRHNLLDQFTDEDAVGKR